LKGLQPIEEKRRGRREEGLASQAGRGIPPHLSSKKRIEGGKKKREKGRRKNLSFIKRRRVREQKWGRSRENS